MINTLKKIKKGNNGPFFNDTFQESNSDFSLGGSRGVSKEIVAVHIDAVQVELTADSFDRGHFATASRASQENGSREPFTLGPKTKY